MTKLLDWLDHRTGYRSLLRGALYERIPGGARWRYIWGSALTFAIFVQFVTGIVLWAAYSANAQGAWESVYFIQNQMLGGWLVRGIHHFMAQATIVLLVLHLMQVIVDGAYRAPREVNFWFGLALLFVVLGLSLTGYLLPWDEKGYWATKVATSIASWTPVVGPQLQQLLVGGSEYGHLTLTRFFALHAGVLPAALVILIVGHVYLFRRHGVTVPKGAGAAEGRSDGNFWPDQFLRDGVACLAVMAAVLALVLWSGGAHLGAPADPTEPFSAARPEWYFLFLFQWLKYFPAGWEVVGGHVIPGLVLGLIALMPVIGNWRLGHRFNVGVMLALLAGVGLLTWLARAQDAADATFVEAKLEAEQRAERVAELASSPDGIPPAGGLALLRSDPLTQGPEIFVARCASCHRFNGHDGLGEVPTEEPEASDLAGYGSREWLRGLLDPDRVATAEYFGATDHARGRMVRFVQRGLTRLSPEERDHLLSKVIMAVSAEAELPAQAEEDSLHTEAIQEGRALIHEEPINCTRCHLFRGVGEDDDAPVLTGWGSREWMMGMVHDPTDDRFYGDDNDRMPSFGAEGILSEEEIGLVVDWLRGDWYESDAGDDDRP
ncbi:MAG: cytochrome b N-terminal domain-containing protein [Longimicrobiales bacterium]|nr:cytochrome b N-terminal domain-containing protein [Longimicrobiales bacterium]